MNNFIRFYWLLIILVFLPFISAICQDYPMIHFTVDEGLPSNTIYNTYRDSKGFIWIATDKGIARYNGIKFTVYTTFNGLPDNEYNYIP
jgi:ligand-binding sensor domain-containing protein